MDEDRKVSRLPLIVFSLIAAAAAVALYFFVRQTLQEAQRARFQERDRRLVQIFQDRVLSRLGAVRVRVEGAELLIAATPPSARTPARPPPPAGGAPPAGGGGGRGGGGPGGRGPGGGQGRRRSPRRPASTWRRAP